MDAPLCKLCGLRHWVAVSCPVPSLEGVEPPVQPTIRPPVQAPPKAKPAPKAPPIAATRAPTPVDPPLQQAPIQQVPIEPQGPDITHRLRDMETMDRAVLWEAVQEIERLRLMAAMAERRKASHTAYMRSYRASRKSE